MKLNDFIFSNKRTHRLTRHLVFWGLYGFYFWVQSIVPENISDFKNSQPYKNALVSLSCFLPTCIFLTYTCIYWILPQYLVNQKYILSLQAFLPFLLMGLTLNYFTSLFYFDHVVFKNVSRAEWLNSLAQKTSGNRLELAYTNLIWAVSISAIALGIKFSKNWYLQQQENLKLMRKKGRDEFQLQKVQIQPEYLSQTLKSIYHHLNNNRTDASALILRLSELLSYSLYESKDKLVSLDKEIRAIKNFIYLEQTRENSFKIQLEILGMTENKFIPPMLILSILQDSLVPLNRMQDDSAYTSLIIKSKSRGLYVKILIQLSNKNWNNQINWNSVQLKVKQKLELLLTRDYYEIQISPNELDRIVILSLKIGELALTKLDLKERGDIYEPA